MDIAVLFSGGKDSTYACYMARKLGYNVKCLITLISKNPESFMFHTPAIELAKNQAELMDIPLILWETRGKKEHELKDLKNAIKKAVEKCSIEGIVTGAIESVYQASRIQKICNELNIECFNPLWQNDQIELLEELIKNKFEIILSGVFAYPLGKEFIGRKIDKQFIEDMKVLKQKYNINPGGEGGEMESMVIKCPLFKKRLSFKIIDVVGKGNSWRGIFQ